jgi:hypothetical protein
MILERHQIIGISPETKMTFVIMFPVINLRFLEWYSDEA